MQTTGEATERTENGGLSRRSLLTAAVAGGVAATLPTVGAVPALADQHGTAQKDAVRFFDDSSLNFQMLFVLGAAGYGAAETGEALSTFNRIHERGDSYRSVYEEFKAEGLRLRKRGDAAADAGRRATAQGCYLRSAMYLDQALFYTLASSRPTRRQEGRDYRSMNASWAKACALFRPRAEPVRIPFGSSSLPGWMLRPTARRGKRPTVILNTGSDAQNIDMYVYGGAAALERGWNALIVEGPGQGANLFLRNQPFIPAWERVIQPVVSWLYRQPDVARNRISLIGQSFGGYLVARAAAFEPRLAAVVCDPGVHNVFSSWQASLPHFLIELLNQGNETEFNGAWREAYPELPETVQFEVAKRSEIYGNGSFYSRLRSARRFRMGQPGFRRIKRPTAILSPQGEQFFPGQAEVVYRWLRTDKDLLRFSATQGAQFHCEPMAPQARNERVFDWLDRNTVSSRRQADKRSQ